MRSGSLLFVAGQLCLVDGIPAYEGTVGVDVSLEDAQHAARIGALNSLAIAGSACDGDFGRLRLVRVSGCVRCTNDFADQATVLNGASDTFHVALGDRGRHVRAALGINALPRRVPVEIETTFELSS